MKAAVGLVETRKQRSVARSVEDIIMTTCGDDEDDIIIVIVFDRCYSMLLLPPAALCHFVVLFISSGRSEEHGDF